MIKRILLILLVANANLVFGQNYNFSFEVVRSGMPLDWYALGSNDYLTYLDTVGVRNGKYAAVIESNGESAQKIKALTFVLPKHYEGKEIKVSGYIKTQDVRNGYAGLMIRIDPGIAHNIMEKNGVTGTTDWKQYEITLPLQPAKTTRIAIGGVLIGDGKARFDDFKVYIDGEDLTLKKEKIYPAANDHEFDEGSMITSIRQTEFDVQNICLLTKIWGFLKYHHPKIASGELNWDYEVFRFLPKYLSANSEQDRNALLLSWIDNLGDISPNVSYKTTASDISLPVDLAWLNEKKLSNTLRQKLTYIYNHRFNGRNHYYIESDPSVGIPIFKNENPYTNMSYPDQGFRLLSLMRYWNIIRYYFPYRNLIDNNWDDVLKEYIPLFLNAKNELEYEQITLRLVGEINDSHANIWDGADKLMQQLGNNFGPSRVEFIEDKLVVTGHFGESPQIQNPLKIGDIITQIGGKKITTILDSVKAYYPASNDVAQRRDIAKEIFRSSLSELDISYMREGKEHKQKIPLYSNEYLGIDKEFFRKSKENPFEILEHNIGYINASALTQDNIKLLKPKLKNVSGIIIDLRYQIHTDIYNSLGSFFVKEPKPFVRFSNSSITHPGEFILLSPQKIQSASETFTGKVVVLVNENTQSSMEYSAMAFKVGENTVILGSKTAGADGNMTNFNLPGGLLTSISGIGIYYPNGGQTQRIGIVPHIQVSRSIAGIVNKKDELLDAAINVLLRGK